MGMHIALPLSVHQEAGWLIGRVLDSRVCGFELHQRHCIASLSKTLYPLLSTVYNPGKPIQTNLKNC